MRLERSIVPQNMQPGPIRWASGDGKRGRGGVLFAGKVFPGEEEIVGGLVDGLGEFAEFFPASKFVHPGVSYPWNLWEEY